MKINGHTSELHFNVVRKCKKKSIALNKVTRYTYMRACVCICVYMCIRVCVAHEGDWQSEWKVSARRV